MKHPVLVITLSYALGVLIATLLKVSLWPLLIGAFILALLCLIPWQGRPLLLGTLFFLIGVANFSLNTSIISPHDLRRLIEDRTEQVTVQGTLLTTPTAKPLQERGSVSMRSVAEVEAKYLRLKAGEGVWRPAFGRITISTSGMLSPEFFRGQEVEVGGWLHQPKPALAEGLFDYRAHLANRGIYYQLQVGSTNEWHILATYPARRPPLAERFIAWGKTALRRGLPVEDESLRLEWALTLGWKPALTDEVSEPFIRAATYHIFAVDGLRVAIISAIFLSLFRMVGLPRAWSGLIVISLLWFYAYLTAFQASAIRATVMASVVLLGWALRRPSALINSLFLAALIILMWEPTQLFQAGFQLSFMVVLCIILLMPAFEEFGKHLIRFDPWLPVLLRPSWHKLLPDAFTPDFARIRDADRTFWQRAVHASGAFVWETFLISLVAWLGSIPLAAYYFHILTPVSAPANLLTVPLCGLVLICNLISLLLAGWLPFAAEFYNHAGWFLMNCIRVSSDWFEGWPAAYSYVSTPTYFTIALYYVLLLTLATGWVFRIPHRAWALTGLAVLSALWCANWLFEARTVRMAILPIQGASALFVDAPGRKNDLLINCGNENSAGSVLKPFLESQGVNKLPHLLLTHGELYHVGGAQIIRENFEPEIDLSPVRFRSAVYRQLRAHFELTPGLVRLIGCGDRIGSWQVLHPKAEDHFSRADDNALVLRGELRGTSVLLLSTLGMAGQNALCNRGEKLRADIVVAGIPKQSEPLADPLLDQIKPRLIVISDVEAPATGRANHKLRERLQRRSVPVIYTSEVGATTISFRRGDWKTATMRVPKEKPAPAQDALELTVAGSE